MIKSPLRYPGGKSRAVEVIADIIPDFEEFREPFLGGASVFLYAKQKFPERKFWVNDLYYDLYIFWKILQNNSRDLLNQIYEWKYSFDVGKDLFAYLKENLNNFDDIRRAAAFFIFNRITFSGTSLSGGYSEAAFQGRFTETSIERLGKSAYLLPNAEITNLDYEKLVAEEGRGVFLFLDPPYYSATKSALYGKNGDLHKGFDHIRFAEVMKSCKHKWLITYDDSDYVRDLFSFANIHPWNLTYGMRNVTEKSDQIGKELFISNYLEELPLKRQTTMFIPEYSAV